MEALEERIVLSYLGAFRVPDNDGSGRVTEAPTKYSYSFGGDVSAVDGNEMWLSAHAHNLLIGKISIPDPVKPSNKNAFKELPVAQPIAPAFDITQGLRLPAVQGNDQSMVLGDIDPDGNQVRWVMHDYYNVSQTPYRVLGSYNTQTRTASGPYGLYDKSGQHVRDQLSGDYLSSVPPIWASRVGGTYVSGGAGLPGQGATGAGPGLYAYTPPKAGADPLTTRVTATPLLEYPFDDHLPESQRRGLDGWNRASEAYDAVWIGDTVVVAARFGIGQVWYGSADGPGNLYDWSNPDKGYHAESYEMRLLFYRAGDLAAVARGDMKPWEPRPYANVLMPHLMGADTASQVNDVSMSFDEETGRFYIVQTRVDQSRSQYDRNPIVHVYDMSGPDALKRWANKLSGRRPILMGFNSPFSGFNSGGNTFSGAQSTGGATQQLTALQPVSLSSQLTSPLDDDTNDEPLDAQTEDEVNQFWSLDNGLTLASLNNFGE